MPPLYRGRPLKRWRWVGVFCEEALICVGQARVGPLRQSFWAVWDRERRRLHERTSVVRSGGVTLGSGFATVRAPGVRLDVQLQEAAGIETVCAHGRGYVWTRKQGGIPARVGLKLGNAAPRTLPGLAVVDDTAGYHRRHTEWWWAAGVGHSRAGAVVAWNLVSGINDPPEDSERTVWIDSVAHEVGTAHFAADLSAIDLESLGRMESGRLRFAAEAQRHRREDLLVVASDYRQPFGSFSGSLPGVGELQDGLGVTEHHRARW